MDTKNFLMKNLEKKLWTSLSRKLLHKVEVIYRRQQNIDSARVVVFVVETHVAVFRQTLHELR